MGAYVNPKDRDKENWLAIQGDQFTTTPPTRELAFKDPEVLWVCLVDNGLWTAAGIVFDEREYEAFTDSHDERPKGWIRVPKDKLMDPEVSNLAQYVNS